MSRSNWAKCHARLVLPNQEWWHPQGDVRVMAVAEGWAMVRKKGATPFVLMVKKLDAEYQLGEQHYTLQNASKQGEQP